MNGELKVNDCIMCGRKSSSNRKLSPGATGAFDNAAWPDPIWISLAARFTTKVKCSGLA
jgi:hypothetical protein